MEDNRLESIKRIIISDEEYLKWMEEIIEVENEFASSSTFNNSVTLDHGIEHMNRVAIIVYKLMMEYGYNKDICILGYIAGLIHDIGMIHGKKHHALNGSDMSKIFLRKFKFLKEEEIDAIANAIMTHGSGDKMVSDIGLFLALADKIDMCKERSLGKSSPIKFIDSYNVLIDESVLEIHYELTDKKGIEGFYIIPKSIDVPKRIAHDLDLEIKFYINGKLEDFKNRNNYDGPIYKRIDK